MMNNENGRSMVEMLGVLAIIGVLSVAGIAGYTMAMRKYRANEIVDMASKLVVMAQVKSNGAGGTANVTDLGLDANTTVGGTTVTADCQATTLAANDGKCVVTISGGEEAARSMAQEMAANNGTYTIS